ncbi:zinc ribbon domain-containing protein [Duganella levis]|uniref:Zinc-ribbon domain-containing protein n=1 Tax=Duganella levis TaxID=2692169 RepID=A0ABW9W1F6_9BURK|nr:zinc ribbon domain-containing protein [Duganella levis]MYN27787.1 zinc-ribbon domain-containing protein [Duganella levis]
MFCRECGTQQDDNAAFCHACGNSLKPAENAIHGTVPPPLPRALAPSLSDTLPEGVKGWSWGAFLLNWIWAIGNRTWIGLLALIPYVGFIFAFWLGFKGREMAWKNGKWESLEHFNRVQKAWSRWAVGLTLGSMVLGVVAALALPAYQDYLHRAGQQVALAVDNAPSK